MPNRDMPDRGRNPGQERGNRSHDDQNQGRGFASMDDERQRRMAAEGGRAAHRSGNAHEFDSAQARRAASKPGQSSDSDQ